MTNKSKRRFFYGYYILIAAFIIVTVGVGGNNSFGVLFAPIMAEFGWPRAITSGAYSIVGLFNGFGGMLGGKLNDRFGPRMLLTVTTFMLGLGYLLLYRLNSIWELYLFYGIFAGIGMSCHVTPVFSTVARWYAKRRGIMTGFISAGTGVGTLFMSLYAGWLISTWNWRVSFVGIGILSWVTILGVAQLLRRDPQSMGEKPDGVSSNEAQISLVHELDDGLSLSETVRTRQWWLVFFVMLFSGYVIFSVSVHIVIYATGIGIAQSSAINIIALAGLLNIPSRLLAGAASDKIGSRRVILIFLVIMLVALIWLLMAKELWMLYLFGVLYGFAWGGITVPASPMIAELFGLKSHGTLFGFSNAIYSLGIAIGPVLTGLIYDITRQYQIAFIIFIVLILISLVLTWFLISLPSMATVNKLKNSG